MPIEIEPQEHLSYDDDYEGTTESEEDTEEESDSARLAAEFRSTSTEAANLNAEGTALSSIASSINGDFELRVHQAGVDGADVNFGGSVSDDDEWLLDRANANPRVDAYDALNHQVNQAKRSRVCWSKKHALELMGVGLAVVTIPSLVIAVMTYVATVDAVNEAKKANLPKPPKPVPFDLMDESDFKKLGLTDQQIEYIKAFLKAWQTKSDDDYWDSMIKFVGDYSPSLESQFVMMKVTQNIFGPKVWEPAPGEQKDATEKLVAAYENSGDATKGKSAVAIYKAIKDYKNSLGQQPPRNFAAVYCQFALAVIYKNASLKTTSQLVAMPKSNQRRNNYPFNDYVVWLTETYGEDPHYLDRMYHQNMTSEQACVELPSSAYKFACVPVVDEKAILPTLGSERQKAFNGKMVLVKKFCRHQFLNLANEKTEADDISVLAKDFRHLASGTLVYRRKTNLSTRIFALPHVLVNMGDFTFSVHPSPSANFTSLIKPENLHRGHTDTANVLVHTTSLAAVPGPVKATVDTALQVAGLVGMVPALMPEGLIITGTTMVIQMIFGQLCGTTKKPLLSRQVIESSLKTVLVHSDITNAQAVILTDYDWLRDGYDSAWTQSATLGRPVKTDADSYLNAAQYQQFKTDLAGKLGSDTGLLKEIELMRQPDFLIPGFPTFMLGANCALWLMKIDLILQSANTTMLNVKAKTTILNHLNDYIAHAGKVMAAIDIIGKQRIADIGAPYRSQKCVGIQGGGATGVSQNCTGNWSYDDNWSNFPDGDGIQNTDAKISVTDCVEDSLVKSGCDYNTVQNRPEVDVKRSLKLADAQNKIELHYYLSKRADYEAQVADWQHLASELAKV